jgi:hypothetical protein
MKIDALKQYAKLRQQLMEEKSQLEQRLNEINQVLGSEDTQRSPSQPASIEEAPARPVARRGRRSKSDNSMSLREAVLKALEKGPLARKELVGAVEGVGYAFNTSNPLNSIGSVLYAKNTPVKNKNGKFFLDGRSSTSSNSNGASENGQAPAKKKRTMSAAAKARISAAATARWAKRRAAQK